MKRKSVNGFSAQRETENINDLVIQDVTEFSDNYDETAPPVGPEMTGHDTFLLGPKVVLLDSFVVDLLHVDTSAQTFRLKLLLNMDWEDDGTIEPEVKFKRGLGRAVNRHINSSRESTTNVIHEQPLDPSTGFNHVTIGGSSPFMTPSVHSMSSKSASSQSGGGMSDMSMSERVYKTGKYVLKQEYMEDPLGTTWNPEVVLVNAVGDEDPIEAGSKFHSVQMLCGRPVITRSVLYQPECRCEFTFENFPFDETDLVVNFSSNKWNSEEAEFLWSERLSSMGRDKKKKPQSESSYLRRSVDSNAIGGVGLSEFEIIKVRVRNDRKDVNSMQRYDNAEGAFSQAQLIITVRRDPYSYLLRVASVAELLMVLEVLSFFADCGDLSARFSVSGTIFLALVSLYGPMADALPKVSVVTRVDKWNLQNFFLLFASNVENLLAFLVRNYVYESLLYYTEVLLGGLYVYFVVRNLLWFLEPLADREEYNSLIQYIEDMIKKYLAPLARKKRGKKGNNDSGEETKDGLQTTKSKES